MIRVSGRVSRSASFSSPSQSRLSVLKKTRVIGFGLALVSHCASADVALPLAEVMNDHRTFLPYIGLVIAVAGAAALLVARLDRQPTWTKIAATCAVVLFLCANGYATYQRNKVWKTEETLWHDVVIKSPGNGSGLMNYGNTLMAKGDFAGALDYFHRAQQLTPQYSVLLINLAIAEDADQAERGSGATFPGRAATGADESRSYTYYARYLLSHSRAQEARAFLRSALELSPTDLTARELLDASGCSGGQSTGDADSGVLPRTQPSALSRRALRGINRRIARRTRTAARLRGSMEQHRRS